MLAHRFLPLAAVLFYTHASLCPEMCTATVDGSSWPCRYYNNDCQVNITSNPSRLVDLNIAVINPYVGGLGDLMTQVEPSIRQALQDIDDSAFLPGYRLNAYLADSKCTVPDAIQTTVAAMTDGVKKHVVFSDSCSAACEAVNDALRHFNVLQVGPGCVSVSLSDSARYPYFTRMAPSFRFNVIVLYELFKFLNFHRIGLVYGYRSINSLAKDLFLELMASDNAAGTYSWTALYTHRVEFLEDAQSAVAVAQSKDSRINFMALYEVEGSMTLCQAYKRNMLTPDFNWFVASGWWNNNYIMLYANTAKCPCTIQELSRVSYSLIASDRGPMLDVEDVHGLSGKKLSDLYKDYTNECEGFANGKGTCNHQWSGYFYDGIWLIASVLHGFLVDQNRSVDEIGTAASQPILEQLSMNVDFMGQTGRVRQFNGVDPQTTPPSLGDRDGIVLLRQATGPPEAAFVQLAFRTEDGLDFKRDIKWSSTDDSKMVTCSGSNCDFATAWVPADRAEDCPVGQVWSLTDGCGDCPEGSFRSAGMASCQSCAAGSFSNAPGAAACTPCLAGTYARTTGYTACIVCSEGYEMPTTGASQCTKCPVGSYAAGQGLRNCITCPVNRSTVFEGATSEEMCVCSSGQRLDGDRCMKCQTSEICEGGRIVGLRPSNQMWSTTLNRAGKQRSLSQMMGKNFFQLALGVRLNESLAELNEVIRGFDETMKAMLNGNDPEVIQTPEEVVASVEVVRQMWTPLKSLLETKRDSIVQTGVFDMASITQVADQTTALRVQSNLVVEAYRKAAQTAGAELNGLQVDIAGRQRTLIQQICTEAMLIALRASVPYYRAQLRHTSDLFAETEETLVFGIEAVGIPELRKMCTMHQMENVNFYYRQVRPIVREIVNSPTDAAASEIALERAQNLSSLTTPFFDAMVLAVELFTNDTGACDPLQSVTDGEWLALTTGLCHARTELGESQRFYMQIANGLAVQSSKVELSVLAAGVTQLFKDLVQGRKSAQMPAPLTQEMLEHFINILDDWTTFAIGLDEGIRQDQIAQVDVLQQIGLEHVLLTDLNHAKDLLAQAAAAAGTNIQIKLLDLTGRQELAFHHIPSVAYEVLFGGVAEEELNTTIESFLSLQHELILGAPATDKRMALLQITDLCIIRAAANAMTFYRDIEHASWQIVRGSMDAVNIVNIIDRASPDGMAAMAVASNALYRFYQGQVDTCENLTYTQSQWEQLMAEITRFAGLAMDASAAFLGGDLSATEHSPAMAGLTHSIHGLYMGEANVPVQPSQAFLGRIVNQLYPTFLAFQDAMSTSYASVRTQEDRLYEQSWSLLQSYTENALALDPTKGQRYTVAMWQQVNAKKVYKEHLAERYDQASQLRVAELEFETSHRQLKDGGGGLPGILSNREDLLASFDEIDRAWLRFKGSKEQADLEQLLQALQASLPLFATPDVEPEVSVPWFFYIILSALGLCLCLCTAGACIIARQARKPAGPADRSAV